MKGIIKILKNIESFKDEYSEIIKELDSSIDRVKSLEKTLAKSNQLNIKQKEIFNESARLVQHGFYRAAIIIGWTAFADYIYELVIDKYLLKIKNKHKNLQNIKTKEQLQESSTDYAIIVMLKEIGIIDKHEMKSIHGLLAKRNECAHPSDYNPSMNQAIGYIDELIERIGMIT